MEAICTTITIIKRQWNGRAIRYFLNTHKTAAGHCSQCHRAEGVAIRV